MLDSRGREGENSVATVLLSQRGRRAQAPMCLIRRYIRAECARKREKTDDRGRESNETAVAASKVRSTHSIGTEKSECWGLL